MEGNDCFNDACHAVALVVFWTFEQCILYFVKRKCYTVQSAPCDEIERCSVPQSSEKHCDDEVQVLAYFAVTVSSKGYI